jgi:hypothetical protein
MKLNPQTIGPLYAPEYNVSLLTTETNLFPRLNILSRLTNENVRKCGQHLTYKISTTVADD